MTGGRGVERMYQGLEHRRMVIAKGNVLGYSRYDLICSDDAVGSN